MIASRRARASAAVGCCGPVVGSPGRPAGVSSGVPEPTCDYFLVVVVGAVVVGAAVVAGGAVVGAAVLVVFGAL